MKLMKNVVLVLSLVCLSAAFAGAETVVLDGLPQMKDLSSARETSQVEMTETDRDKYRCRIVKRDGAYYWASRQDKSLLYTQSGEFHTFVEPDGNGYVRVLVAEGKPYYMEHLTRGLKNITYWGSAESFTP